MDNHLIIIIIIIIHLQGSWTLSLVAEQTCSMYMCVVPMYTWRFHGAQYSGASIANQPSTEHTLPFAKS